MIYTTNFAHIRHLPQYIIPVAISRSITFPGFGDMLRYQKLTPTADVLIHWHMTHDEKRYIQAFHNQVLDGLSAQETVNELMQLIGNDGSKDIALICYEKSTDFCHRHLVAKWLCENGFRSGEILL